MDNKKIEQNYEQILENEIAKAEAGDPFRKQLLEYLQLELRSKKIAEEYSRILSSRDKEDASAVWSYIENKRILMELDFLEAKLAKLQNRMNKLSGKKQLDEADQVKLQNYYGEYALTEAQMINLQKHRTRSDIERINKAIRSYVSDAGELDLPFAEIVKSVSALSKEEKKAFVSAYAKAGERFMLLSATELANLQTFGE